MIAVIIAELGHTTTYDITHVFAKLVSTVVHQLCKDKINKSRFGMSKDAGIDKQKLAGKGSQALRQAVLQQKVWRPGRKSWQVCQSASGLAQAFQVINVAANHSVKPPVYMSSCHPLQGNMKSCNSEWDIFLVVHLPNCRK